MNEVKPEKQDRCKKSLYMNCLIMDEQQNHLELNEYKPSQKYYLNQLSFQKFSRICRNIQQEYQENLIQVKIQSQQRKN